jgi:hypothetical protein
MKMVYYSVFPVYQSIFLIFHNFKILNNNRPVFSKLTKSARLILSIFIKKPINFQPYYSPWRDPAGGRVGQSLLLWSELIHSLTTPSTTRRPCRNETCARGAGRHMRDPRVVARPPVEM